MLPLRFLLTWALLVPMLWAGSAPAQAEDSHEALVTASAPAAPAAPASSCCGSECHCSGGCCDATDAEDGAGDGACHCGDAAPAPRPAPAAPTPTVPHLALDAPARGVPETVDTPRKNASRRPTSDLPPGPLPGVSRQIALSVWHC